MQYVFPILLQVYPGFLLLDRAVKIKLKTATTFFCRLYTHSTVKESRCMLNSHFSSTLSLPDTQILGRFLTVSLVSSWLSSGNKNFPPLLFWISPIKPSLVAFKWQAIAVKTLPPLKVLWCCCPAQVHAPDQQWD